MPMTVIYENPNIKGISEVAKAIAEMVIIALFPFPFNKLIKDKNKRIQESIAVKNGPKLAYPNGTRLKHEYVERIVSPGAGAKFKTAP